MLIVHAGLSKTGSSAIQQALYRLSLSGKSPILNYPNISGAGFGFHAQTGTTSGNANIQKDFAPWNEYDAKGRWEFILEKVAELPSDKTTVLSSENLSEIISEEHFWASLGERNGENARVVLYLRGPFSHFLSSYGTRVKFGLRETVDEFVDEYLFGNRALSFKVFRDLERMKEFSNKFNVPLDLFHYETVKENLLDHFLNDVCLLNLESDQVSGLAEGALNARLSMHKMEFQRGVNHESLKLARLFGWESTSSSRMFAPTSAHPESHEVELSKTSRENLQRAFFLFRDQLPQLSENFQDFDCELDRTLWVEKLSSEEKSIRAELFDLGRFVARSFKDGYIAWDRRADSGS